MDVEPCSLCALLVGCSRLRVRCDGCEVNLCCYCAEFVGMDETVALSHITSSTNGDAIRAEGRAANIMPQPLPPKLLDALLRAQRSGLVVPSVIPLTVEGGHLTLSDGGVSEQSCVVWCGQCKLDASQSRRSQSPRVESKNCQQCGSKVAGFGSFNNKRRTCMGCGVSVCSKNCSRSVLRPGKGVVVLCSHCIVSGV